MRIPSGKTDIYLYFVAVDATDLVTRETGLSTWTVQRSRNGAAEVAYTTPTITEIDATTMPGVYALLVDEDTTIASSSDSEEYCVHITHSGMAPVTRTIELYRRTATSGRTLSVDANSRVDVGSVLGTAQTAGDLAALITTVDDYVDTEIAAIQSTLSTINGKLDVIDDFLDTEIAAILADTNELQTDWANGGRLDLLIDAIKAKTDNLPTDPADASDIADSFTTVNSTLSTIAGYIDTEVAAIKAKTDNLPASPAATSDIPSAATIADAVWDEAQSGHTTVGTFGKYLDTEVSGVGGSSLTLADIADAVWDEAISGHAASGSTGEALAGASSAGDPWATALPGAYGAGTAGQIIGDNLNATVSSRASQTSVDTIDDLLDTEIAAIKAKTDNLPADPADASDIAARFDTVDTNIATVAGYLDTEIAAIKAKTDNLPASPAATGDIPTANANADALLDRANGIETGYTPRQAFRLMSAVLAGKSSGHPGSPVYRNLSDSADRVSATVSSGNRSAVTHNP